MTGQLTDHESEQVENHVRNCESCQESLKEAQAIRHRLRLMWSLLIQPSHWRWIRVSDAILKWRENQEKPLKLETPLTRVPHRRRPWQLVLASSLIGVLLGGAIVHVIERSTVYQTLNASPQRTNSTPVILLWLQFRPGASVADINAFMQSINAHIIDGPDSRGRFITAIPIRKPADHQSIVHYLQSHSDIILTARPVSRHPP